MGKYFHNELEKEAGVVGFFKQVFGQGIKKLKGAAQQVGAKGTSIKADTPMKKVLGIKEQIAANNKIVGNAASASKADMTMKKVIGSKEKIVGNIAPVPNTERGFVLVNKQPNSKNFDVAMKHYSDSRKQIAGNATSVPNTERALVLANKPPKNKGSKKTKAAPEASTFDTKKVNPDVTPVGAPSTASDKNNLFGKARQIYEKYKNEAIAHPMITAGVATGVGFGGGALMFGGKKNNEQSY